jgi:hypothetical protein
MPPVETDTISLDDYLAEMGEALDCFFTFEDVPDSEGSLPWIEYIAITPDSEIESIDDLVDKLNEELDGVTVVRSLAYPSVVHLIADVLMQEGYVMEDEVDVEYSGDIGSLPYHLGTLLDGRIGMPSGGPINGIPGDSVTQVDINVQNQSVRDVLTGAVPFNEYNRIPWESYPEQENGSSRVVVRYFGPRPEPEENGDDEEPDE